MPPLPERAKKVYRKDVYNDYADGNNKDKYDNEYIKENYGYNDNDDDNDDYDCKTEYQQSKNRKRNVIQENTKKNK